MTTEEAKKIRIVDYLHSLGYSPVKQQGVNLWYKSPFREENEPSFKVNTEREQWFDFGLGKGGNIIALAAHLYATESVPYILPLRNGECSVYPEMHRGTDTACPSRVFLFSQAVCHRAEFPAA